MKPTSKCADCKHRYEGCHSVCLLYKKYREQIEEIKASKINSTKTKSTGKLKKSYRTIDKVATRNECYK